MTDQKLLPSPFGYGEGFHIALTAQDGFNEPETIRVVMSFGCPLRTAQKAVSCLRHSGRYDCVMSPIAWRVGESGNLRWKLLEAGVRLTLRGRPHYEPSIDARRDRYVEPRKFSQTYGGDVAKRQAQNL